MKKNKNDKAKSKKVIDATEITGGVKYHFRVKLCMVCGGKKRVWSKYYGEYKDCHHCEGKGIIVRY